VSLGYQAGLAETAVERLVEIGYLDDEEFARAWVGSRDRARPRGEHALRLELARKGIDRQTIEVILDERSEIARANASEEPEGGAQARIDVQVGADIAAAGRLLDRRRAALLREPDPRKRRAKAYALLARNGFDPDVCRTVAARIDEGAASAGE
jgi:regulatory protein